jgi:hydrogenase maturation protein HypF
MALRRALRISGAVQGVGFRPFAYRLASELGLSGFVANVGAGVRVEVEGPPDAVCAFERRLPDEVPPHARLDAVVAETLPARDDAAFEIRASEARVERAVSVLPDLASCPDCVREVFSPADRRYRYPFTNCTRCGPRYSVILDVPYDRARTTMERFALCARCRAEYEDPRDRRFHAEPIACPDCGPRLELWGPDGRARGLADDALRQAAEAVRSGRVLALKGLGGFHLIVDARSDAAVRRLRERKRRPAKPLAVMAASLEQAAGLCELDPQERALLGSSEAPIVVGRRRSGAHGVASAVAPDNPCLGLMLPYTPLHHLLLADLGFPVVATSGNRGDEPLCTDEREALQRLEGVADMFLVHDRPIARPVDDSLVRMVAGRPLILRRARGYAPLPVAGGGHDALLAVGAHQKNAIAVAAGGAVVLGPHVGDLDTAPAVEAHRAAIDALARLFRVTPSRVACDAHPDYASTQIARSAGLPLVTVQHHYAHALACLADNRLEPPVLAITWDGSGHGPDGTLWGGEALRIGRRGYERVAGLRRFRLPGGERAAREPRRSALGVLHEAGGPALASSEPVRRLFTADEHAVLLRMLERDVSCPRTSSAGRLFDALSALLGLRARSTFEGEAAMALEFAIAAAAPRGPYPFGLEAGEAGDLQVDWAPLVLRVLEDRGLGLATGVIASRIHDTMAAMVAAVAARAGEPRVLLTGGCFQNKALTERTIDALRRAGHEPFWHRDVPPNDGGIALGQARAAEGGA